MKIRTRLAVLCSVSLIVAGLGVGTSGVAGAGTTRVDVVASCSFEIVQSTPIDRPFSATVTVPDQVAPGETFDAEVLVELDMGVAPPGTDLAEFRVISEWSVAGAAEPTGPITVVSPTRSYQAGDTYVYDAVVVSLTAGAYEGESIALSLLDITYELRWSSSVVTIGPDCTLPDAPIHVTSVPVGGSTLTCLGHPVTIMGSSGDDVLVGTSGRDVIHGVAGNNRIYGLGGNDIICGGTGNDIIFGGSGNNTIDGGGGFNILFGSWGRDTCTNGVAINC